MPNRRELHGSEHRRLLLKIEGAQVLLLLALLPLGLCVLLAPRPLVLPIFTLTAFALAGLAALVAWRRRERRNVPGVTLWDLSGALVLLGGAAVMFSSPENVLQLFGYAGVQ
jgi:hypothetical protein